MQNIHDIRPTYRTLFNETISIFSKIPKNQFYGPTILPTWKVNNIISHLAANALNKTSDIRKMKQPREKSPIDFSTLAKRIDTNNEKWVEMFNDLEQKTLLDFYQNSYDSMLQEFEKIQDLNHPAVHDVLWYSDEVSPWWLDIDREYTELWMHTAQICSQLKIQLPFEKQYSSAFYAICLLAVKRLYRTEQNEILIEVHIGTQTYVLSSINGHLDTDQEKPVDAVISMTEDAAWKLFSGIRLSPGEIDSLVIEGNPVIGRKLLEIESVMVKVAEQVTE